MRPYLAILRARFLALLQYRAAAAAGLGTQIFWGFIRVMVFTAFFRAGAEIGAVPPMPLPDVISYVWLGQCMVMLMPFRAEPEVQALINSGNVAYELLRPVDQYNFWYARSLAARTAPTVLRALPLLILALLFFGLRLPPSPACAINFALSLVLAALLAASFTTLISISMLWTVSGHGVRVLVAAGVWIFSGIALPIPFFPDAIRPLIEFLPFRGILDTPFRLYVGHIPPGEAAPFFAHQLAWFLALVLLGRISIARGRRKLVVQGG